MTLLVNPLRRIISALRAITLLNSSLLFSIMCRWVIIWLIHPLSLSLGAWPGEFCGRNGLYEVFLIKIYTKGMFFSNHVPLRTKDNVRCPSTVTRLFTCIFMVFADILILNIFWEKNYSKRCLQLWHGPIRAIYRATICG